MHQHTPVTDNAAALPSMFEVFERSPDLVVYAGRDGYLKRVNSAVAKTLGYTKSEIYQIPIRELLHPDHLEETWQKRTDLFKGKTLHNFENRYLCKDGSIVWLEWTSIYLPDNDVVFGIAKNITARKLAEQQSEATFMRLRNLASHFKTFSEKDRKFLAYELHEELAQLTAALKMELETITVVNELPPETRLQIKQASAMAATLLKTIQRISFSVSPALLEEFGLEAAMEWLCSEFTAIHKIPCSFTASYEADDLSQEVQIDFFRICQKALNNVAEHSQAQQAFVSIAQQGDTIKLCIIDNGQGFDPQAVDKSGGLFRIQERVASVNGTLTLESEIGQGTKMCVAVQKNNR